MAEAGRNWSRDAGELAACFTVHARDLFGHACVLADADRDLASDLVQATFEAAAGTWCTLRDLPADQCRGWLRDTLADAAERQTGHPAGRRWAAGRLAVALADHRAEDGPVPLGLRRRGGPGAVRPVAVDPRARVWRRADGDRPGQPARSG